MPHEPIYIPPERIFETEDGCVWCGATEPEADLRKEHIIPASFGGHLVIPKGCCTYCQGTQSAYIGQCCDKMFAALRFHHGLPLSRKKKLSERTLRVLTDTDTYISVPQDEAPGVISMPVLDMPRLLSGTPATENEFQIIGFYVAGTGDDGGKHQLKLEGAGHRVAAYSQIPVSPFTQTLAHIGHSYYMTQSHLGRETSLLLPIAQGDLRQSSRVIGGWSLTEEYFPKPKAGRRGGLHQILPFNARSGGIDYIAAHIRLFTHLRPISPLYTVVLAQREIPKGDQYFSFTREKRAHGMEIEVTVTVA